MGLPGAEQGITAGGRGLFQQTSPAQGLRTAPRTTVLHLEQMAT